MSETVLSAPTTLAELFKHSSGSFKELYLALATYGHISLLNLNDQYGRFGVWGVDSGADRTGRGSLDDLLRNDPNQKLIIFDILVDLCSDLERCISLVGESSESYDGRDRPDQAGEEWFSDGDSSFGSGSDSDSFVSKQEDPINKKKRILRLLAIIVDHIQSLYKTSALLRRPKVSNKYIRSLAKHREELIERDTKRGHHMERDAIDWDIGHVAEKIRQWARNVAKPEAAIYGQSNYICIRLAAANLRRREQLRYWQDHPDRASNFKPQPILLFDTSPKSLDNLLVNSDSRPDEDAVITEPEHRGSKASKTTRQSFSTVAQSDLNDAVTFSGRPRTEYVASIHGRGSILRVPDVPKVPPELPEFECPYCFASLETKAMSQRDVWKKHVFRDLRPYVCTFEHCQNPEKLYMTRHDWIYHEMQIHRRQWLCPWRCNKKFATKDLLESHLRTNHSTIFTEAQLAHLIDICHRPLEMEEDGDCPLCPVTFSLSTLQPHLAAHLEELALFILPVNTEDRSHDADSENMEQISGHAARSDHANSDDELSELEFEDTSSEIVSSQDPEAFKRLVGIVEKPVIQLKDWLLETGKSYATDVYNVPIRDNAGTTVDVGDKLVPLPKPVVATDKIKPELRPIHDPDDRASSGCRRTSLDSSSKPTTINAEPRNPKIPGRDSRPPSPLYDPYRSSGDGGEIISIPASSGERHSHHRGPYVATMDNADIDKLSREGGSRGVLRVSSSREGAKYRRPVYPSTLTRHPDTVADDYGDDGYGYTNPRDLAQYDLSRPARLTPQRRDSYDVSRPSRLRSYDIQEPGPPVTTRGLNRIAARSPLYDTPPILVARSVPKSQEDSLVTGSTSGAHGTRKESAKGLGVPFNPMNTMDLRALKDELNQKDEKDEKEASVSTISTPQEAVHRGSFERGREPSSLQLEPSTGEERGRHDTSSSEEERRPTPRLVSPPREVRKLEENKPRGILRPPREKFPEDPVPMREGVTPLKDAKRDGVPPDARWTKISRRMVNPEALEAGKERFEAREDFVIVLRVLTKEEIQAYANATQQIRAARKQMEEMEEMEERRRRERHERHKRERELRERDYHYHERDDKYDYDDEYRGERKERDTHSESDTSPDDDTPLKLVERQKPRRNSLD